MGAANDIRAGDPALSFTQRSSTREDFTFDTAAGRYLLLCLFGTSADAHTQAAIKAAGARKDLFDDRRASFFGVSADPADAAGRLQSYIPGYRFFWDEDAMIAKLYGAQPGTFGAAGSTGGKGVGAKRLWVLIDPNFRVVAAVPFAADQSDIDHIIALTDQHSNPQLAAQTQSPAPVLVLPRVFEPEFCEELRDYVARSQMLESGFMVQQDGATVLMNNSDHKKRSDCLIDDVKLQEKARMRIVRTIAPQISKAFQFNANRIERYIVGRYAAEDSGFFQPHRDNTTRGTAHRRFAVTIALNDDYEGGELNFPEFGPRTYKPPAGGAVVFSCSLLHQVLPMTSGERFVFLPFLYDDAAAKIRDRNRKFVKR